VTDEEIRVSVLLVGSLLTILVGALVGALAGVATNRAWRGYGGSLRIAALLLTWIGAGGIIVWMFPGVIQAQVWQCMHGFLLIVLPFLLALALAVAQSLLIRRGQSRSLLLLCVAALLGASPGAYLALSLGAPHGGFPAAMYTVSIGLIGALVGGVLWGVPAVLRQT